MFFIRQNKKEVTADVTEDTQLIELAKANPADFDLLYERYFARIYNYCLRRLGQPKEAEDLTSLVFTRAFSGLAGYRGGSIAAWLFQIAHNAVINHLKAKKAQVSLEVAVSNGWLDNQTESGNPTLDRLLKLEEQALVSQLIEALPAEQRELLTLSVVGGLTAREVGQILGKSEGAVWMALHRIVQRLQKAYQKKSQVEVEVDR